MYIWKVDLLVEDFKNGNVTAKEELKYLMVFAVVTIAAMDPVLYTGYSYTGLDTDTTALMVAVSMIGLYACYKINESGDNRDFIERVICLGLPVVVRVMALFIPLFFVGVFIETQILSESLDSVEYSMTSAQMIITLLVMAFYYWYLGKKIRAISAIDA